MHPKAFAVKWRNQPMEEHRRKRLLDQVRDAIRLLITVGDAALSVEDRKVTVLAASSLGVTVASGSP
jgi:hypothetical protein